MNAQVEPNELGQYLRARRAELSPDDVGLPAPRDSRRRATGLRREEVAALASISPDYYARIEQGRRDPPWPTLDAIARVLRIDDAGREYLFQLSAGLSGRPRRRREQTVAEELQRLLDGLTSLPALVLGRRMDVLAWNAMAKALFLDFDALSPRHRNYVRLNFTEPAMRTLSTDWEQTAQLCVAQLHMEVARDPHDPRLSELVGELSVLDADFRRWWSKHHVAARTRGTKRFHHPVVGDMSLDWDTLAATSHADQQLVYWSAEPDTDSRRRLAELAQHVHTQEPA